MTWLGTYAQASAEAAAQVPDSAASSEGGEGGEAFHYIRDFWQEALSVFSMFFGEFLSSPVVQLQPSLQSGNLPCGTLLPLKKGASSWRVYPSSALPFCFISRMEGTKVFFRSKISSVLCFILGTRGTSCRWRNFNPWPLNFLKTFYTRLCQNFLILKPCPASACCNISCDQVDS